jgi:two-component system, NarL family, invasion response regulator UvrY
VQGTRGSGDGKDDAPPARVLIVDDQETFRSALRDLVAATPGLTLVGEADSGEAALEAVEETAPEFVIIDKRMPGIGGVEATRLITERHPAVVVLLVSIEVPDAALMDSCGAAAFLRKQQLSPRSLAEVWRSHRRPG